LFFVGGLALPDPVMRCRIFHLSAVTCLFAGYSGWAARRARPRRRV
jgi:hypothetical protein